MYAATLFGWAAQNAHAPAIAIPQMTANSIRNSGGFTVFVGGL
jgi:hypothetical protein